MGEQPLSRDEDVILRLLQSISQTGATDQQIQTITQIPPVYLKQALKKLLERFLIGIVPETARGPVLRYRAFNTIPFGRNIPQNPPVEELLKKPSVSNQGKDAYRLYAQEVMSSLFKADLQHRRHPALKKLIDLASLDFRIVGAVKQFSHPSKAWISNAVQLLRSTNAEHQFLLIGDNTEVMADWFRINGYRKGQVDFYFLSFSGDLLKMEHPGLAMTYIKWKS